MSDLKGTAFIKSSHAAYVEGARAIIKLTVDLSSYTATIDARKGGGVTLNSVASTLAVYDDEGALLYSGSPTVTVKVGVVQSHYVLTGERLVYCDLTDPSGAIWSGTSRVLTFETQGTVWEAETTTSPPADTAGTGTGLLGRYYQNRDLLGEPLAEAVVNPSFEDNDSDKVPGGINDADDWSVRYTGRIKYPDAGQYRFRVQADDGFRMYLDGRQAMDYWSDQDSKDRLTGWFTHTAGELETIWLEFYAKGNSGENLRFQWQTPSSPSVWVEVPTAVLYSTDGTEAAPEAEARPDQTRWYAEEVNRYGDPT